MNISNRVKVPNVSLAFWILKILATTLGETAGDTVTMSLAWGYLWGTALFGFIFLITVSAQMAAHRFRPLLYWLAIIATTTVGTTLADFADRSLGIGYAGGTSILLTFLLLTFGVWKASLGTISIQSVSSRPAEAFYWLSVMFSQTLGTAVGDWVADTNGLGYASAASIFATALCIVAVLGRTHKLSPTAAFWSAFVLTRPLGAVVGDLIDKPATEGGFGFDRLAASAILISLMSIGLMVFKMKPAERTH